MDRNNEAIQFFSSFNNLDARTFVSRMMQKNYTDAILLHHRDKKTIIQNIIAEKCTHLVTTFFGEIDAIKHTPEKLFPLFNKLSRNQTERHEIWFPEFLDAYERYKHTFKLHNRYTQLQPYLKGNTYCDIGCGGGDLVSFLKNHHHQFTTTAGIDVLDWRTDSIKKDIDFQMLDFTRPQAKSSTRYDTATCLAVLHHAGKSGEEMDVFLKGVRSAVKSGGRLIIEEDVILPEEELRELPEIEKQTIELRKSDRLYDRFLRYDSGTQRAIIELIDFLANALAVGVPEMAFPCGFRTINNWIATFQQNGFSVDKVEVLGFVKGNFNQTSHVLFILDNLK